MDVQVAELSPPEEPPEEGTPIESDRAESDQEQVTTLIQRRGQTTQLDLTVEQVIKDKRPEGVAKARSKGAAKPPERELVVAQENTMVALKQPQALSQWESGSMAQLRGEFLHICLPLFFSEPKPIRSLGITSAVAGEGKTSVAWLVSHALASNSRKSVVLVECDWERPTFSKDLGLPPSPGLAEYLSGESDRTEIRHQFLPNLSVIPAGLGGPAGLTALAQTQWLDLYDRLANPDELIILDLPSLLGSYYGTVAARLAESLLLVVRADSTRGSLVTSACEELSHLRVEGIILNRVQTRIPRWVQRLL